MEIRQSKSVINQILDLLGPKKSFLFGIVAMVLVGSAVGFYILLFSGGISNTSSSDKETTFAGTTGTTTNTSPTTNTATGGAAAQPSTKISLASVTSDDHAKGDIEKAGVVIVEFSDLECPFCKQFHGTMQQIVDDYGDQVTWVYRHFPLDSLHPKARKEAEATECAAEQGGNDGFWAFTDRLMEITPSNNGLDVSQLPEIAGDVGLDVGAFQTCLDSGKYADKVESQYQDAVAAGGNGTPYSVAISASGETVPISGAQPVSAVKSIIDSLL